MANYQIHQGDNVDTLRQYEDCHFDAIITDPPYGIEFLGKDWDNNTGAVETWSQCFRVLKPGGYLLAFSAARTYHNLASNIESVGFEIRDQLMWLYASGFPKAQDVGKGIDKREGKLQSKTYLPNIEDNREVKNSSTGSPRCNMCHTSYGVIHRKCNREDCIKPWEQTTADNKWSGWKTALKPAHEPIVMARKPFKGSTIDNVLKHGVGALNIDDNRIGNEKTKTVIKRNEENTLWYGARGNKESVPKPVDEIENQGRFPSNVMGEIEGYQKFFYCPKVSRKERHCGFEQDQVVGELQMIEQMGGYYINKQREEQSQTGKDIWLPHKGHIQVHGLKEVYAEWLKQQNKDPLAHIETLSNYSQGDVKNHPLWDPSIGTNLQRLKHKIMEHNKDLGKKDPLAHIPVVNQGTKGLIGPNGEMNHDRARQSRVGNNHPTVKPVALMRYLINLVTPPNSVVLDPFTGSGSTGMAACELGHTFVGCELDPHYVDIAKRRIEGWCKPNEPNTHRKPNPSDLFEDLD